MAQNSARQSSKLVNMTRCLVAACPEIDAVTSCGAMRLSSKAVESSMRLLLEEDFNSEHAVHIQQLGD